MRCRLVRVCYCVYCLLLLRDKCGVTVVVVVVVVTTSPQFLPDILIFYSVKLELNLKKWSSGVR